MNWDIYKAKAWTLKAGMDHIRDGLYSEGGELVYEAKWGEDCESEFAFRQMIRSVLCWNELLITDIVEKIMGN